jgi:hypothetical protein
VNISNKRAVIIPSKTIIRLIMYCEYEINPSELKTKLGLSKTSGILLNINERNGASNATENTENNTEKILKKLISTNLSLYGVNNLKSLRKSFI